MEFLIRGLVSRDPHAPNRASVSARMSTHPKMKKTKRSAGWFKRKAAGLHFGIPLFDTCHVNPKDVTFHMFQ